MDAVQPIIQGGAVGMAVFSLWVLYKIDSNHIAHNQRAVEMFTEALKEDTKAKEKLAAALALLTEKIK